jgi:hypothetical protein
MPRTVIHKDPEPGYYEGRDGYQGNIYEVRNTKDGLRWYAMLLYRDKRGCMASRYVGHAVRLGERIEP